MYNFEGEYVEWNLNPSDHSDLYKTLLPLALQCRPVLWAPVSPDIASIGRILTFETEISTHDGAPVAESRNFVDMSDVPPVDAWFYLKNNNSHGYRNICSLALFCWIPKQFEAIMQSAINVEILDSYRWLDENNPILYSKIIEKLQTEINKKP